MQENLCFTFWCKKCLLHSFCVVKILPLPPNSGKEADQKYLKISKCSEASFLCTKHFPKATHARPFWVQSFSATSCTTFSSTRNLLKFSLLSSCAFATKTIHINGFNQVFVKSECLLHRHKFCKTFIALQNLSSCAFRAKTKIVLFRFRLCMQSWRKRFFNVDGNLTSSIMVKTTCVQKKRAGVSFPADHRLNFSATTTVASTLVWVLDKEAVSPAFYGHNNVFHSISSIPT